MPRPQAESITVLKRFPEKSQEKAFIVIVGVRDMPPAGTGRLMRGRVCGQSALHRCRVLERFKLTAIAAGDILFLHRGLLPVR